MLAKMKDDPVIKKSILKWNEKIGKNFNKKLRQGDYVHRGILPEKVIDKLEESLNKFPLMKFRQTHCREDYVRTRMDEQVEQVMSRYFEFYRFEEESLEILKEIVENLKQEIEDFMMSSFRVINVRGFIALPGGYEVGPNKHHRDGLFPNGTCKILLYITEASVGTGFTYLKVTEDAGNMFGPRGTYILFNSCEIIHSGKPPMEEHKKKMIEITLCPWSETIIEPVWGGNNARYPLEP